MSSLRMGVLWRWVHVLLNSLAVIPEVAWTFQRSISFARVASEFAGHGRADSRYSVSEFPFNISFVYLRKSKGCWVGADRSNSVWLRSKRFPLTFSFNVRLNSRSVRSIVSISHSLSLSLFPPPSLSPSLSILSLFISLLYLFLSLCLSIFSLTLSLPFSLSVSLHPLSYSLSLSLSLFLPFLFIYLLI